LQLSTNFSPKFAKQISSLCNIAPKVSNYVLDTGENRYINMFEMLIYANMPTKWSQSSGVLSVI